MYNVVNCVKLCIVTTKSLRELNLSVYVTLNDKNRY